MNPHLLHLMYWQVGSLPLAPPGKPAKVELKAIVSAVLVPLSRVRVWMKQGKTNMILDRAEFTDIGESNKVLGFNMLASRSSSNCFVVDRFKNWTQQSM